MDNAVQEPVEFEFLQLAHNDMDLRKSEIFSYSLYDIGYIIDFMAKGNILVIPDHTWRDM